MSVIIWLCQRIGISQWRFHNYGWMLATWLALYSVGTRANGVPIVFTVLAACWTFIAARFPDREAPSLLVLRIILIFAELPHWAFHVLHEASVVSVELLIWGLNWDASCPVGLMVLAAQYATTIRTIPPSEASERYAALRASRDAT